MTAFTVQSRIIKIIQDQLRRLETYRYKSIQLVQIEDVLDKFWVWQITGYGGDNLQDYKRTYLSYILATIDLPNNATVLDVGMSDKFRTKLPTDGCPDTVIGFAELESHARNLAKDLGRPRYVHYEIKDGALHKFTYNLLNNQRYEITSAGIKRTNL